MLTNGGRSGGGSGAARCRQRCMVSAAVPTWTKVAARQKAISNQSSDVMGPPRAQESTRWKLAESHNSPVTDESAEAVCRLTCAGRCSPHPSRPEPRQCVQLAPALVGALPGVHGLRVVPAQHKARRALSLAVVGAVLPADGSEPLSSDDVVKVAELLLQAADLLDEAARR